MRHIHTVALGEGEINASYALARLAFPGLTVREWKTEAKKWMKRSSGRSGALLAMDRKNRPVGLAPFQIRQTLGSGRCLWVEQMVCVGLLDTRNIREALVADLFRLGAETGCQTLEIGNYQMSSTTESCGTLVVNWSQFRVDKTSIKTSSGTFIVPPDRTPRDDHRST